MSWPRLNRSPEEKKQAARARTKRWYYDNPDKVKDQRDRRGPQTDGHSQKWRAKNPDGQLAILLKQYGMTVEQFRALECAQSGVCKICEKPPTGKRGKRLFVDHDHATQKVRGLLCLRCNLVLGHAQDSAEVLRRAATYLESAGG